MEKLKSIQPFSLLALLCMVGMGIMRASDGEDGFSLSAYYLGVGITLAGASVKLLSKAGAAILIAGIIGNMFLKSTTPLFISSYLLAGWYLFDFLILKEYKDN